MARIRTIKPDFWTDEKLTECSLSARLLFIGLLNFADDNGNLTRSAKKIKMQIFPADVIDCEPLIIELSTHGVLSEYSVSGEKYLNIKGFKKHQLINRPSKTSIPEPDLSIEIKQAHGGLTEDSLTEGKGREGKVKEEKPSSSAAQKTGAGNDARAKKEQRLAEITEDAIAAFNQILGKPKGLLPAVHATVGKEKRRKQVGRILKVVRDICQEIYKDPHITKAFWIDYFTECDLDPFKSGRQPPGKGHENWSPSFEYLTREDVVIAAFDKAQSLDEAA